MTRFRIHPFEDMGVPGILANADGDGMRVFQSAVLSAHEYGEAGFQLDGITHRVVRQRGSADIELDPHTVIWRFDDVKLVEMLGLIVPMLDDSSPGHQYVGFSYRQRNAAWSSFASNLSRMWAILRFC